jgi:aspartate ammonia-lyase
MKKIIAKESYDLKKIVRDRIAKEGPNTSLCDIDLKNVQSISSLFHDVDFNGDISEWNTSNVLDMSYLFTNSTFNGDISR